MRESPCKLLVVAISCMALVDIKVRCMLVDSMHVLPFIML